MPKFKDTNRTLTQLLSDAPATITRAHQIEAAAMALLKNTKVYQSEAITDPALWRALGAALTLPADAPFIVPAGSISADDLAKLAQQGPACASPEPDSTENRRTGPADRRATQNGTMLVRGPLACPARRAALEKGGYGRREGDKAAWKRKPEDAEPPEAFKVGCDRARG